jgi:nicotinamidase-related amidase
VINTARYMTSVAKALNIPVVITQQYTKVFGDTVTDCFADPADIQNYPVVDKKQFSMCVDEVNLQLKTLNKKSVVLFGIEAHVCLQQTCLDLLEQGNEVHLILDGISSQQPYVSTDMLEHSLSCYLISTLDAHVSPLTLFFHKRTVRLP